jgi:3-methyladenine DNA glycosylase/8-oxoguanine DNA glycosylase
LAPRTVEIPVPRIDLDLVVRSHGWYDLPPFSWDGDAGSLSFVFLEGDDPWNVFVSARPEALVVSVDAALPASRRSPVPRSRLVSVVSRVLDLTADLSAFHAVCRERAADGFGWIAERGAGRILRAPTLFEDAVKVLATTNCTWGLTKVMVTNLIAAFGRGSAFPPPAFVAGLRARDLEALKFGYRAPYLAAFAERVASGTLDLARWEDASRPAAEVEAEIRSEKGFGPYAADTLGRLLGRHAKLGLDAWSRKKVAEIRFRGRAGKDARAERFYRPFGPHAGLAFWLDVTRDWHEGRERLWP